MWIKPVGQSLLVAAMSITSDHALAQGAQRVQSDYVQAYATVDDSQVYLSADRLITRAGTILSFAVVSRFDSATGEYSECRGTAFDLTSQASASAGSASFSFVPDSGVNCPVDEPISLTCEPGFNTSVLHNQCNGLAKIGGSDPQQFTTHGPFTSHLQLDCVLRAFGDEMAAQGDVMKLLITDTP